MKGHKRALFSLLLGMIGREFLRQLTGGGVLSTTDDDVLHGDLETTIDLLLVLLSCLFLFSPNYVVLLLRTLLPMRSMTIHNNPFVLLLLRKSVFPARCCYLQTPPQKKFFFFAESSLREKRIMLCGVKRILTIKKRCGHSTTSSIVERRQSDRSSRSRRREQHSEPTNQPTSTNDASGPSYMYILLSTDR